MFSDEEDEEDDEDDDEDEDEIEEVKPPTKKPQVRENGIWHVKFTQALLL